MLKAVIIDDEEISGNALRDKVERFCADVNVLKSFSRPEEALIEIRDLQPDIVFLDIEMPKMNGFSFLKQYGDLSFEVIFTTAYSQYAIEALRISALDFLLKPIDSSELVEAVNRVKNKITHAGRLPNDLEQQIQIYFQQLQPGVPLSKIALPVLNGLEFIDLSSILKVEAENVYSRFFLNNGKKILVSRTLKETEKMLSPRNFMRVHKSVIVNLDYIRQYIKGEGGTIILSDGSEVEVSRRTKTEFLARVIKP